MKMKKERMIKICIFPVLFLLSLLLFNSYFSRKNEGATEMMKATLPVMEIYLDDAAVNRMHGYLGEIDAGLLRDAVTPIDSAGKITVAVRDYDYDITAIAYQLLSGSDSSVLEEGVLNKLEEKDGIKSQELQFHTVLKEGEEYLVCYTLRLDSSRKVNYYSRLKYGVNYHDQECLTFARGLSDKMLQKDEDLNRYLESNDEMINNNLASVNIHSSFEAVTYAQSSPERMGEPDVTIKEVNGDYTVVELRWILAMKNGKGQQQYCDVVENYKIRYSASRMYLLDYSRTQESFYDPEVIDAAKNRITLGTGTTTGIRYVADEDNEKVCFVKNRQLWYYSYQATAVTRVFSFWSEDKTESRSSFDQHDIDILNMDQDGNVEFVVYGYMNRGRHEGQNGIAVYRFLTGDSSLEELAFVPSTIPYQNMKEDIGRFSYLNQDGIFYFLQDGVLYRVDTNSGEWEIQKNNLTGNCLTASSDRQIIAIQEQEDNTSNTKITLFHLENGQEFDINAGESERIQSIGFVLSDFVYGTAPASEVKMTNSGGISFPMSQIRIVDETGEAVKVYDKTGYSIIEASVDGNVIELVYGQKSGVDYVQTGVNRIAYKEEKTGSSVSVEYGYDSICYNQVYLAFPAYIYIQTVPSLKAAKEIVSDDMRVVNLVEERSQAVRYLVYVNGVLSDTCHTAAEAIARAEEMRGLVVNQERQTVWESNISSYQQVVGLGIQKVDQASDTFAACVSMAAALEGKEISVQEIRGTEGEKWNILGQCAGKVGLNLYGITLDQALYYVSKETPVLVGLGGEHYVVLMSYNSTKVRYKDPLLGEDVVVSKAEFRRQMEQAGNEYYSYIKGSAAE